MTMVDVVDADVEVAVSACEKLGNATTWYN